MLLCQLGDSTVVAIGKAEEVVLHLDRFDGPKGCIHFQLCDFQESFDGLRDLAESILEFLSDLADRLDVLQSADVPIDIDFVPHVLDIFGGK